ncbi:MAG: hypothetical protein AB2693_21165 [Candidatus Thiodiazotropha sp.]
MREELGLVFILSCLMFYIIAGVWLKDHPLMSAGLSGDSCADEDTGSAGGMFASICDKCACC